MEATERYAIQFKTCPSKGYVKEFDSYRGRIGFTEQIALAKTFQSESEAQEWMDGEMSTIIKHYRMTTPRMRALMAALDKIKPHMESDTTDEFCARLTEFYENKDNGNVPYYLTNVHYRGYGNGWMFDRCKSAIQNMCGRCQPESVRKMYDSYKKLTVNKDEMVYKRKRGEMLKVEIKKNESTQSNYCCRCGYAVPNITVATFGWRMRLCEVCIDALNTECVRMRDDNFEKVRDKITEQKFMESL